MNSVTTDGHKAIYTKERRFPVKVSDKNKLLQFMIDYIKFPLENGVNQIIIHSDGSGVITRTEERKMNQ